MEEHEVEIKYTIDDKDTEYKITLETQLPLFKTHERGIDYTWITYKNEVTLYATAKQFNRRLQKTLLKAQKRYNKLLKLRKEQPGYDVKIVDLRYKL